MKAPIKCERPDVMTFWSNVRNSGVKCLCATRRWELPWHLCREFHSESEPQAGVQSEGGEEEEEEGGWKVIDN